MGVPPDPSSIDIGKTAAAIADRMGLRVKVIGSTDLTHYGPRYGFVPKGTGPKALQWAQDSNDKEFIDLAVELRAADLVSSAAKNGSACGPGAAAATVSAAKDLGSERGLLLAQTSSSEVMHNKMGTTSTDSVGYAAIVF